MSCFSFPSYVIYFTHSLHLTNQTMELRKFLLQTKPAPFFLLLFVSLQNSHVPSTATLELRQGKHSHHQTWVAPLVNKMAFPVQLGSKEKNRSYFLNPRFTDTYTLQLVLRRLVSLPEHCSRERGRHIMQKVGKENQTNAYTHTHTHAFTHTHRKKPRHWHTSCDPEAPHSSCKVSRTHPRRPSLPGPKAFYLKKSNVVIFGDLNISIEGSSQTMASQSLHFNISNDYLSYSTWANCSRGHSYAPSKIIIESFLLSDYSCEI